MSRRLKEWSDMPADKNIIPELPADEVPKRALKYLDAFRACWEKAYRRGFKAGGTYGARRAMREREELERLGKQYDELKREVSGLERTVAKHEKLRGLLRERAGALQRDQRKAESLHAELSARVTELHRRIFGGLQVSQPEPGVDVMARAIIERLRTLQAEVELATTQILEGELARAVGLEDLAALQRWLRGISGHPGLKHLGSMWLAARCNECGEPGDEEQRR